MIKDTKLAELINTKLCHDLAGPIGAVNNSTEYLDVDNNEMRAKARHLLDVSAMQSIHRLQFFRHLFGITPDKGEANIENIMEISTAYFSGSKISLTWAKLSSQVMNGEITHLIGKIITNLILIASSSLIKGGEMVAYLLPKNDVLFKITAEGKSLKCDEDNLKLLQGIGSADIIKSNNVNYYYVHRLLEESGTKLTISYTQERIEFELSIK